MIGQDFLGNLDPISGKSAKSGGTKLYYNGIPKTLVKK